MVQHRPPMPMAGPHPGMPPQQPQQPSNGRSPALQNTLRALGILGAVLMAILTVLGWLLDQIEPAIYAVVGVVAAYFAITMGAPVLFIVTGICALGILLYYLLDISLLDMF